MTVSVTVSSVDDPLDLEVEVDREFDRLDLGVP